MEDEDVDSDGNFSDDDMLVEENGGPWFAMGMSKEEKLEARKPWQMSLIIKLLGATLNISLFSDNFTQCGRFNIRSI